jgi:hypothetical protein
MAMSFWFILIFYVASIFALRWTRLWRPSFLAPLAMWCMIGGIVFICQPWLQFLYRNGLTVLIFGLIYWNIAGNMKKEKWESAEGVEA